MVAQTITPGAGLLSWYRMQLGDARFPQSFRTRVWPSECCTQNPDSSEKTTLRNSCIQLYRSVPLSRGLSLCCIVKGSRTNGVRADIPHCCKLQSTKLAETLLMVRDIVRRFCKQDSQYVFLSFVSNGKPLRSCMSFSTTLSNPLIPHSHNNECMSISAMGDITETIICTLDMQRSCVYRIPTLAGMHFFLFFEALNKIQTPTLQCVFRMRNPLRNFSFMNCFRCHFTLRWRLNELKY